MRFLYIFPHPDDESFGPATVIYQQIQEGQEVHLLTLTRGEATKQRFAYGYSKLEMGKVRTKEMECVKKVLGLTSLKILDFPDNGLAEWDPREIEKIVKGYIASLRPDVVVSYPVYGISGFNDHLVMHAVVKRVFVEMKSEGALNPRRLAFFTLKQKPEGKGANRLKASPPELIDCEIPVQPEGHQRMLDALGCYSTYQKVIEDTGVKDHFKNQVVFELYNEAFDPPLSSLSEQLPIR